MSDRYEERLRIPPHSPEAEQAVIGGLMLDPDALSRIAGLVVATDFFNRTHQSIFRAVLELTEKDQPTDAVTVGEWFDAHGIGEQVAGGSYLVELASATPSAANIKAYAQIVAERSKLRKLIDLGTTLAGHGYQPEGRSADEIADEALRLLDGAQSESEAPSGLRGVELGSFMEAPASTIGYAVRPVVPRGVVTLWGGHGGAGKSISALQLVAHGACAEPWQGLEPDDYLRCVYVSLEDPGDLVRYRLRRVCESYQLNSKQVEASVRVLECPNGKAALMTEVAHFGVRSMVETPLMIQMRRACEGADLIVIDNASEAFGGNENDRQAVRAFMGALTRIAKEFNSGLILLAHIDKAAARTSAGGNTYSGSTAWHNSARSRLAIVGVGGADGEPETVQIRHEKNNLGKRADPISLKWNDHGVLVPLTQMDRQIRVIDYTEQAYAVVRAAARLGIRLSPETVGQNPGHKAVQHLSEYAPFLAHKRKQMQFHAELQALSDAGRIVKQPVKTANRKTLEGWVPAAVGCAEPAPNAASNAAPNASNSPSPPPYKTPLGGFYMGGDSDSAHHSAQTLGHSAQDDTPWGEP